MSVRGTRHLYRRVIVGVDFSGWSIGAAEWVVQTLGPGTSIRLIHVISVPEPPRKSGELKALRSKLVARMRVEAAKQLADIRRGLGASRVRGKIRFGKVADELSRAAREWHAHVIVLGQRDGTPEQARRHSVARTLLLDARTPVLTVRGEFHGPPRRVLAAVDGSVRAKAVIATARQLALRWNAPVTVLSIIPASLQRTASIGAAASELRRAQTALQRAAYERCERSVSALVARGIAAEALCVTGDPARKIAEVARRIDADLIVVGLRKAGRLERAMFGVVAQQVLALSQCPVLVAAGAGK